MLKVIESESDLLLSENIKNIIEEEINPSEEVILVSKFRIINVPFLSKKAKTKGIDGPLVITFSLFNLKTQ